MLLLLLSCGTLLWLFKNSFLPVCLWLFKVIIMALIVGHSQVKYFSNYVQDNSTMCLFYSGCKIEDLLTYPAVLDAVPVVSVSINYSFFIKHRELKKSFIWTYPQQRFQTIIASVVNLLWEDPMYRKSWNILQVAILTTTI